MDTSPPPERRQWKDPYYRGPERRRGHRGRTIDERRAEFVLLRDRILLAVGVLGVVGIAGAAVTIGIKDPAIALAALTLFGGLLGAPTILRLDEVRERKRDAQSE